VPAGFAHGFLTLCHQAEVLYKTTDLWHRASERALHWCDPELAIDWPQRPQSPIVSEKDAAAVGLAAAAAAGDLFP